MEELTAAQHLAIARHSGRPNVADYVGAIFTDFFEQRGDRLCGEDPAILGGVAMFHGHPVTVIGTRKGKNLEENLRCNFGMPSPEGYRKARRLMEQAEKFRRPIVTLIDTSGAYPGLEAEARGQGEAIARNLLTMSQLTVPVVAVILGEGNSSGQAGVVKPVECIVQDQWRFRYEGPAHCQAQGQVQLVSGSIAAPDQGVQGVFPGGSGGKA